MKFGRNLHKHQVPLWASSYLDYDGLKYLIKHSRVKSVEGGQALDSSSKLSLNHEANSWSFVVLILFAAVLGKIDREINNVQGFYHKVYTTLWDEVSKFYISPSFLQQESWEGIDRHELLYFLGTFIHCRSELKKIQWYGTVNAYGFKRLYEKLGHSHSNGATSTTPEDIKSQLSSAQFSIQIDLLRDLQLLQKAITSINRVISEAPSDSSRSLILDHFISHRDFSLKHSDRAYEAIKRDDVSSLDRFMQDNVNVTTAKSGRFQTLVLVFIQLSISYGSAGCIGKLLLPLMKSIPEEDFTVKDYHRLVVIRILVAMGQLRLIEDPLDRELTYIQASGHFRQAIDDSRTLLSRVLSELGANVQAALLARDSSFSYIPLHYAAQHGLLEACELLLDHMQGTKNDDSISSSESINKEDSLGCSPLRVAISRSDNKISKLLLGFFRREQPSGKKTDNLLSGALLADAIKSDPGILNELVVAGANVDHQGRHGETALYIAARSGDEESVKVLLSHKASITIAEKIRGWTPLIVASMEGHVRIVHILIDAGATQEYKDLSGWTAIDHAAFRGHIALAKKLRECQADSCSPSGEMPSRGAAMSRSVEPIRMALNECLILVNLGSCDSRKYLVATNLSPYLAADKPTIGSELGLSIEISLVGKQNSGSIVDLPILEETINKPLAFYTGDPHNDKLMFKLFKKAMNAHNCAESVHIGSGIALLNSLKPELGCDRESLIRDYKVPILSKNGLDDIGTVTFSFLLVKPHLQSTSFTSGRNVLWKNGGLTKIVGHRGIPFVGIVSMR